MYAQYYKAEARLALEGATPLEDATQKMLPMRQWAQCAIQYETDGPNPTKKLVDAFGRELTVPAHVVLGGGLGDSLWIKWDYHPDSPLLMRLVDGRWALVDRRTNSIVETADRSYKLIPKVTFTYEVEVS